MLYALCDNAFSEPFVATSFEDAMQRHERATRKARASSILYKRKVWEERAKRWKALAADILSCKWERTPDTKIEKERKSPLFNIGMAWTE